MCGIAGVFHYDRPDWVMAETLLAMREAMHHRGPDDGAHWISESRRVGLSHRRLAITERSETARQPMSNEDDSVWVIFNGEIYNHHTLRTELVALGHEFKTGQCDTEVILHAYESWGSDCVERLRGMFAFAVWDGKRRELLLVRDRVGIKPLYYVNVDGRLLFASEIRALFESGQVRKEILPESLYHYLTFLTVPAPETMFRGVRKLEAGSLLKVSEAGVGTVEKYWNPTCFLNDPLFDDTAAALRNTEELLEESVSLMTSGDMPMGATLSGGIDSSILVALMKRDGVSFSSVTMDYEVASDYSETSAATEIADELAVKNEICRVTAQDLLQAFGELQTIQNDYPVGAQDLILLFILSQRLRRAGIRVCVFGEGGDELGGYPSYFGYRREYHYLKFFSLLPSPLKETIYRLSGWELQKRLGVAMGETVASRRHIQSFTEEEKRRMWVGPPANSSYAILEALMGEVRDDDDDSFLRRVLNVEFKLRLPEFMLPRIDYPTMAGSLEARVPFLDHKLVEYSLRLPMGLKMQGRTPKYLFRTILSKYLHRRHVERRKIGFGKMLTPFLNETAVLRMCREVMREENHPLFSFLGRKAVWDLIKEHERVGGKGFQLWTLYSLAKWLETHQ
jgi:asparagine synthase (glutamine-hydrolysing)